MLSAFTASITDAGHPSPKLQTMSLAENEADAQSRHEKRGLRSSVKHGGHRAIFEDLANRLCDERRN